MARFFDDAPVIRGQRPQLSDRSALSPAGDDAEDPDLPAAVLAAYEEIARRAGRDRPRRCAGLPAGRARDPRCRGECWSASCATVVEVLPLYSRLSWEQQQKIFQRGAPAADRARDQRGRDLDHRTWHPQPSSTRVWRASAATVCAAGCSGCRSSRCRRRAPSSAKAAAAASAPGLCLRLYRQAGLRAARPPSPSRRSCAPISRRCCCAWPPMDWARPRTFPFIDAPDARALNDGYRLLQELQALDERRRRSPAVGRAMARLPLDPRLARALLESKRFHAESELLAISCRA